MRLFVAVVPPDDVLDDLEQHLEPRREAGPRSAGPTATSGTSRSPSSASARARLDDLTEALARSAARRSPLVLRLAGAGAFPNPYAARVLWAGVEQLRGDLGRVARGIRSSASSVGASPDGTRFHPHLTLGRFGRPTEATRWIRALDTLEGPAWRADRCRPRGVAPRPGTGAPAALRGARELAAAVADARPGRRPGVWETGASGTWRRSI